MLEEAGYNFTQLICDTPHLFNQLFHKDFSGAYQIRGQEGDRPLLCMNKEIKTVMPLNKTRPFPTFKDQPLANTHRWINRYYENEQDTFCYRTAETTAKWLEENYKAGPFFLWVDIFDPHEPWDAPEYMVKRYDPDYKGTAMFHPNYGYADKYTEAEIRNLRAHYSAESELVDRWLGRVLQKIDDLDLWDDSIVLVTSDHGTSIGEHNRTGKSNINHEDDRYWPIYPEVSHVPLMLAGGGIEGGKSLDIIVHPVDFLPTLCDLAGAEINPPKPIDGISFASAIAGKTDKHREYTISGSFSKLMEGNKPSPECVTPFVITDRWGFAPIGPDGKPELYDLSEDPLATNNVAQDDPSTAKDLKELLAEHLSKHAATDETIDMWTTS